jgi:hypothetical protein
VHRTWYVSRLVVDTALALDGARAIAGLEFLPFRLTWWDEQAKVDHVVIVFGRAVVEVDAVRQTGIMGLRGPTIEMFRNGGLPFAGRAFLTDGR